MEYIYLHIIKNLRHNNYNLKTNFKIIGSAHNMLCEIIKKNAEC